MKQTTFASTGFELVTKRMRKREFLDEMNLVETQMAGNFFSNFLLTDCAVSYYKSAKALKIILCFRGIDRHSFATANIAIF